jgi:hypothetical protein
VAIKLSVGGIVLPPGLSKMEIVLLVPIRPILSGNFSCLETFPIKIARFFFALLIPN